MRRFFLISMLGLALGTAPAVGQIALPGVGIPRVGVGQVLEGVERQTDDLKRDVTRTVNQLAQARTLRLDRLVRAHPDLIERDAQGQPARKGELLLLDPDASALALVRDAGFAVMSSETIEGTGVAVTRISVPAGMPLTVAQKTLSGLLPGIQVSADVIYTQAGRAGGNARGSSDETIATPVGMIDGAPGSGIALAGQAGFAKGAPNPSNHGSAVASLLQGAGVRKVFAADVYGTDPAGGNALAIARALGWLASKGSKVITISLVGPRNPLLEKSIRAVTAKGVVVVAAVGNDGPAAPPAYPASYGDVVAVTGVDRHDRALIEAGRALHLDYAAPGADIYARGASGQRLKLRGTSFATPLAAARIAAALDRSAAWRPLVDREAIDLGPRGPDATYGRGLLCPKCGR